MTAEWAVVGEWGRELLLAAGLQDDAAQAVVDTLVFAERRGFASHGFMRLPVYVSRVQGGGITRQAKVTVLSDQPALAIVDADAAAGAFSALACVELVMSKARDAGAAVVIAQNANHFGSAGFYTDRMASQGFLGIAVCNGDPWMCAPFGGRAILGTNPIAIGVPIADGIGPRLDMATSEAAHGKIMGARTRGESIPLGWAVDPDGNPTTDPAAGLAGALLPFGGPKGFALAFMVDCLLAVGGARTSDHAGPLYGAPADPQRLGHAFMAITVDSVQSTHEYSDRVANFSAAVRGSGLPGAAQPPMVPGEPEARRLEQSDSWTLDDDTLRNLGAVSEELAVQVPATLRDRLVGLPPATGAT